MDWQKLIIPAGSKLFRMQRFTYMHKGVNYLLEVDEYNNGTCMGHGEKSNDKNFVIESVSGPSMEECLNQLIKKIVERT